MLGLFSFPQVGFSTSRAGYGSSTHLAVTLRVVWDSPRTSHVAHTFKVVEQFVFELPTLVVMYTCREAISRDKLIVYLVSSGMGSLVAFCISLYISSEMINNQQYIFISTLALVDMKEINRYKFKAC